MIIWLIPSTQAIIETEWSINDNHISALLTVVTGLYAIAVPLSIQTVSSRTGLNYRDNELSETFFKEGSYRRMIWVVVVLAVLSFFSWLNFNSMWPNFLALTITLISIFFFFNFIKMIERYVSDFPGQIIKHHRRIINEILK